MLKFNILDKDLHKPFVVQHSCLSDQSIKIIKTEVLCDTLLDTDFGSIAINHTPYVFMGEHNISHPALNAPC